MNAANPALKQGQRGKPFVKRTTATLRANKGARDKATLTAKVLLDGEAETLMRLRQLFMEWAHGKSSKLRTTRAATTSSYRRILVTGGVRRQRFELAI